MGFKVWQRHTWMQNSMTKLMCAGKTLLFI